MKHVEWTVTYTFEADFIIPSDEDAPPAAVLREVSRHENATRVDVALVSVEPVEP